MIERHFLAIAVLAVLFGLLPPEDTAAPLPTGGILRAGNARQPELRFSPE